MASPAAQFAHRYAMKNPDRVAGVAAHSGGSWAGLDGKDKINPDAKGIPFVVSCGESDTEFSTSDAKRNRIDGTRKFAADLKTLEFDVEIKTWKKIGHTFTPQAYGMTKDLVQKLHDAKPEETK
ncbi:MAG: hypothetical protein QM811_15265 [Pirellulales bacterium]